MKVRIPEKETEHPKLGQVGVIAAVCFAIGVIWPALAGVRLVPEVPGKEKPTAPKASPKPKTPDNPSEAPRQVPVSKVKPSEVKSSAEANVSIESTLVVNCRDKEDRRLNDCDKPAFDSVAEDRLKALITCDGAEQLQGTLSIGFELDFKGQKIRKILRGKSTTLDDAAADKLVECAKREFMSATLKGVAHTHPRYLLFYMVRFTPPGTPLSDEETAEPVVKTSGTATIIWNSARIRSTPEDGEVKARLLYGTKVFVSGRQGDWYRVKYDAHGHEGWVHKNALAM